MDLAIKIAPNMSGDNAQIEFMLGICGKTYLQKPMVMHDSGISYIEWDKNQLISEGYLDSKAREKYELYIDTIGAALVYVTDNGETEVPSNKSLYVMSGQGNIYAINQFNPILAKNYVEQKNHHSQLVSGEDTASAGYIEVNDSGREVVFDNQSGHYRPDSTYLKQVKDELDCRKQKVDDNNF